jgi:pimeloyl-ACP methyl ester carboxylesterase
MVDATLQEEGKLNSDISLPVFGESGSYSVGVSVNGPTNSHNHILCLPGILETHAGFHELAELSQHSCATYVLDYSGRGLSDSLPVSADYRMSHCLKEAFSAYSYLLGLINAAEINQKHIHLIGNSMGGLIAMFLALHKPNPIRSIVINDVGSVLPWSSLMGLYGALGRSSLLPNMSRYSRHNNGLAQKLDVDTRLLSAVMRPDYMDLPHQKTLFGISFEEQFLTIDIPMMVIRSSDSQLLPEVVLQRMQRLSKNINLVEVPGNAHPAPYSHAVVSAINTFISDAELSFLDENFMSSSALTLTKGESYERAIS